MLDVTSRLRKAQEDTAELGAKSIQQRAQLHQAETRAEDARRRLGVLRQGTASATTAAAVLGQLQREVFYCCCSLTVGDDVTSCRPLFVFSSRPGDRCVGTKRG